MWFCYGAMAQELVPFAIRKQEKLRGGIKIIGNQILNSEPANQPFMNDYANDNLNMSYVDIDTDPTTFSSSAASLSFANSACTKVRYAGLYWGGMYKKDDPTKQNIKIKLPSQPNYIDIQADNYIYNDETSFQANQYICYKDVTHLISDIQASGEYMIANVKALEARSGDILGGVSAGWALVIFYEDPSETTKQITTFDGYAQIKTESNTPKSVTFSFSGFKTLPAPLPVKARFGVIALEGDYGITGDKLSILSPNGSFFDLSNSVNPVDNFFNSTISLEDELVTDRRPASKNTLGWDIDLFSIPNTGNSIIKNDQVSASFKAYSTQDLYNIFFSTFEVEIIEPKMALLKTAEDLAGNVLNNQTIALGSSFFYGLDFKNIGNDDATDYIITDILPKNVIFDATIPLELPLGVTYSVTTNTQNETELTFFVPNNLVTMTSARQKIRFAVKTLSNCNDFRQPCSEMIANKATSVYKGVLNRNIINDFSSFSSINACNIGTIDNTIVYVDISGCASTTHELLCGENLTLTASSGFDTYQWKNQLNEVVGNSQSVTISLLGTYTVIKTKQNCTTQQEIHHLQATQRQNSNPLIPFAAKIMTCNSSQKTFPQIFLCGINASKHIDLNHISNISSIIWEKYTDTQEVPITDTCPPDTPLWTLLHNGKTITISQEGIYRTSLTFLNGCVAQYYFRVHSSAITPNVRTKNIYCNTSGKVYIENTNSQYEYALVPQGNLQTPVFQSNSSFEVKTEGFYTALIRKKIRLEEDCVFRLENIRIQKFNQNLQIIKHLHESCENLKDGSLSFIVSGGNFPYKAILKNNKTLEEQTFDILSDNVTSTIDNLSPYDYTLTINDLGSCKSIHEFSINKAPSLKFSVKNELACIDNTPASVLIFSFSDKNLDLSKVQYQINTSNTTNYFTKIDENQAFIYPTLPSGTYQITLFYNQCNERQTFDYQQPTPIRITKVNDNTLLSAIKVSADGGSGNFAYYFNGIRSISDVYHLRSFDEGYTDNQTTIKQIKVRAEDDLGCFSESIFEEVFYDIQIPNFFTPNGDGQNDVWQIKNALAYPKMKIRIYDRFGRQISILSPKDSWDGTFQNKKLPSGDYWFEIIFNEFKDRRVYFGNFTLYR